MQDENDLLHIVRSQMRALEHRLCGASEINFTRTDGEWLVQAWKALDDALCLNDSDMPHDWGNQRYADALLEAEGKEHQEWLEHEKTKESLKEALENLEAAKAYK
jgi:hypothetical protein